MNTIKSKIIKNNDFEKSSNSIGNLSEKNKKNILISLWLYYDDNFKGYAENIWNPDFPEDYKKQKIRYKNNWDIDWSTTQILQKPSFNWWNEAENNFNVYKTLKARKSVADILWDNY